MTHHRKDQDRLGRARRLRRLICAAGIAVAASTSAHAQDQQADQQAKEEYDLAKQLANPISSLISVPIQFNYDGRIGRGDGDRVAAVLQPVVPFSITKHLSLVARTILPVVWQNDIAGDSGSQFGLGDTVQSLFLVPDPLATPLGDLSYGVGPVAVLPTSTERLLGPGTFGLGPTGVFLFQKGGWSYGALANHVWGVADTRSHAPKLDATYLQPFLAYTTGNDWTVALNTEAAYNWEASDWAVPVNLMLAKLVPIADQYVQFQVGARYWANEADNGPEGFGARFTVTLLFPK